MDDKTTNETPTGKNVFLIINQQITQLGKDVTRLGRQLENDIVFKEESISRFHAEIRYEDGKFILYDLGSTSGTYVNNHRVERCVLNSGDLISLATLQIMFVNNNPRISAGSSITTRSLSPQVEEREKKDGK